MGIIDFSMEKGKKYFATSILISSNLYLPKSGEVRTYYYNNSDIFESARVYPILKSGRKCELSDTVVITECEN